RRTRRSRQAKRLAIIPLELPRRRTGQTVETEITVGPAAASICGDIGKPAHRIGLTGLKLAGNNWHRRVELCWSACLFRRNIAEQIYITYRCKATFCRCIELGKVGIAKGRRGHRKDRLFHRER